MESIENSVLTFRNLIRLVHLDLKGAPPKVSFYEKLFPFLRNLGATGLLIEYEDMFPYKSRFQDIPLPYAYSETEIRHILKLAEENQLTVIPLVQTFSHLEFLLKKPAFAQLREVSKFPNALCPSHPESLSCILNLIGQLLELHPGIQWLHIGADEVWHLGVCPRCQAIMGERNISPGLIFLWFVTSLLKEVKRCHPDVRCLMWDDMLRGLSLREIKDSGLPDLVEPMVWHYLPGNQFNLDNGLWPKYMSLFGGLWLASAFKGATDVDQLVVPPAHHVANQQAWLSVLAQHAFSDKLRGIALTGWQRFDHFTILCELLPVGLPSLALCLQCLIHGTLTPEMHQIASSALGFQELIPLDTVTKPVYLPAVPKFPGDNVYFLCLSLSNYLAEFCLLKKHSSVRGGFTEFQLSRNRVNPLHVEQFFPQAATLLVNLEALNVRLNEELSVIFYVDTVEEFLSVQLAPTLARLKRIVGAARNELERSLLHVVLP